MIADSTIKLSHTARPRSFAGLMTLYESNYIRMGWLIPGIEDVRGRRVSTVAGDLPLHLALTEQSRYTTTLHLTYLFAEYGRSVPDPDLYIRIYHDARLAEAMACAPRRRHHLLREFATHQGSELSRRWTRNMMLNKWLEYCADKGHSFDIKAAREIESPD